MRHHRGFTIVELLVVISIISILIALLLPSLNGARRQSMDMTCAANLRQCAAALLTYANDNESALPRRANNLQGPTWYDGNGAHNPGSDWIAQHMVPDYLPNLLAWNTPFAEVQNIEDPRNTRGICYNSYAFFAANGAATPQFGPYPSYPMSVNAAESSMALIQDVVSDNRTWRYAPGWKAMHTTANFWIWEAMNNANPSNANRRVDDVGDIRGAHVATFDGAVPWLLMDELQIAYIDNVGRPYYSKW